MATKQFFRFGAIALALALLPTIAPSTAAAQEETAPAPVVGVMDLQGILAKSSAARMVAAQREKYSNTYQEQAAVREKELREEDQELARQRAVMSPEAANKRREEFQQKIASYQKEVQQRRKNLEQAFAQAMNEIQSTVIRLTDKVANEKGMNLIVYRSQVFLFDPGMEITDEILTALNKELPAVTMTDPEKMPAQGAQ